VGRGRLTLAAGLLATSALAAPPQGSPASPRASRCDTEDCGLRQWLKPVRQTEPERSAVACRLQGPPPGVAPETRTVELQVLNVNTTDVLLAFARRLDPAEAASPEAQARPWLVVFMSEQPWGFGQLQTPSGELVDFVSWQPSPDRDVTPCQLGPDPLMEMLEARGLWSRVAPEP
jgi:hypothetical protein